MAHRIAFLSACALALAALPRPAAAADYPVYGGGPAVYGDDLGAARPAWRRGPVVFDERDPGRRGPEADIDGPFGRSDDDGGPRFPRPRFFGPRFAGPPLEEPIGPPPPRYRPVAGPGGFGPAFDRPDRGCTSDEVETVTPAGWRKTVTRRTCFSR